MGNTNRESQSGFKLPVLCGAKAKALTRTVNSAAFRATWRSNHGNAERLERRSLRRAARSKAVGSTPPPVTPLS